ncbi:hypothetical protein IC620_12550 [Hazenella sp. IB182357]|uniref:Uncharacterized protein n=1 Tax=Polycladospora coralii TaxID=2771432 RepID=A0A926NAZ9_9BACL|nr:hypothetical protein [Polycladospora coralii]MBD1373178.1 hypothetical protein [Polycladospora coralii]MBS7531735.1 hypothetical protein [Polycladospora coralii]
MKKIFSKFVMVVAMTALLLTSADMGWSQSEALAATASKATITNGKYTAGSGKVTYIKDNKVRVRYHNQGERSFRINVLGPESDNWKVVKTQYIYKSINPKYFDLTIPKNGVYKVVIECVKSGSKVHPRYNDCSGWASIDKAPTFTKATIEPGQYDATSEVVHYDKGNIVRISYENPGTRSFRVYLSKIKPISEKPFYKLVSVKDVYVPRGTPLESFNFTIPENGEYKVLIQCVQSKRNVYPRNKDCNGRGYVRKVVPRIIR